MKNNHLWGFISGLVACLITVFSAMAEKEGRIRLVAVDTAYAQTSVNTAVFRTNSIVTCRPWQYMAYYDAEGRVVVARRALNSRKWTKAITPYKGNCRDAHNVISLMVDGKGYLHLSFDHHGNPLNYCKSLTPHTLAFGPMQSMLGANLSERSQYDESNVTYPEFYRMSDGGLIFVYRSGASGRGNLVMNRYDIQTEKWSRLQEVLIDGENQRNAYWQIYVDGQDVIHLSWVWRETWLVESNHDLCYACSKDGGHTWQKTDGEIYQLPITAANAEYARRIPQNSELINQTGMTADKDGHPYIATYWRDADSRVPQYRMVWHDGGQWRTTQVGQRESPFSLSGGGTKMIPIARPRLVIDDRQEAFYLFRDAERASKVSLARCRDLSQPSWQISDLTDFSVGAWEPTLDTELWKQKNRLHIFVQHSFQGDGERTQGAAPQTVYVLEYHP